VTWLTTSNRHYKTEFPVSTIKTWSTSKTTRSWLTFSPPSVCC